MNKPWVKTGITVLTAVVSSVGIGWINNELAKQGSKAEKIASIAQVLAGAGLQFTKSQIAHAAGVLLMGVGGSNALRTFITDDAGMVKPDTFSQNLAKAVIPQSAGMAGLGMISPDYGSPYANLSGGMGSGMAFPNLT